MQSSYRIVPMAIAAAFTFAASVCAQDVNKDFTNPKGGNIPLAPKFFPSGLVELTPEESIFEYPACEDGSKPGVTTQSYSHVKNNQTTHLHLTDIHCDEDGPNTDMVLTRGKAPIITFNKNNSFKMEYDK